MSKYFWNVKLTLARFQLSLLDYDKRLKLILYVHQYVYFISQMFSYGARQIYRVRFFNLYFIR